MCNDDWYNETYYLWIACIQFTNDPVASQLNNNEEGKKETAENFKLQHLVAEFLLMKATKKCVSMIVPLGIYCVSFLQK